MPYTPNTPNANDRISATQNPILQNFQTLGAIAGNVNANSALINANAGFNFIYLPNQAVQPNFVATTTNIWTQTNNIASLGNTGQNELFIRTATANTAANQGIPITSALKANEGWAILPSGIMIKWGRQILTSSGQPHAFVGPNFVAIYAMQLTPFNAVNNASAREIIRILSYTTTGFSWNAFSTDANSRLDYFAIGTL